jgi:hypothetical protein
MFGMPNTSSGAGSRALGISHIRTVSRRWEYLGRPALAVGRHVFQDSRSRVQATHVRPTRVPCPYRVRHAEHFERGAGSLALGVLRNPTVSRRYPVVAKVNSAENRIRKTEVFGMPNTPRSRSSQITTLNGAGLNLKGLMTGAPLLNTSRD